ncbi:hypothetical protein ACL6C3_24935 [Capilliphycus salinus ALCB114379]|uniref:hypothetical protein n=1 Tax=Capilliphycus salinus TaxID=2768948 RepID=UPI0039A68279
MSDPNSKNSETQLDRWQFNLRQANDNNVFCHCRQCNYEWVDSSDEAPCPACGSTNVEHIACWQFPDD